MSIIDDLENSFGSYDASERSIIPMRIDALDAALGGGLMPGQIYEIYGASSAGKTSLSYYFAKEITLDGGAVMIIDSEHKADTCYMGQILNLSQIFLIRSNLIEDIIKVIDEIDVIPEMIIVDSWAMIDDKDALFKYLHPKILKHKTIFIIINQVREDIAHHRLVSPGGHDFHLNAAVRLFLKRGESDSDGVHSRGFWIDCEIVRNVIAGVRSRIKIYCRFGSGISRTMTIARDWLEAGIITIKGSFYYYKDQCIGHGLHEAAQFIALKNLSVTP